MILIRMIPQKVRFYRFTQWWDQRSGTFVPRALQSCTESLAAPSSDDCWKRRSKKCWRLCRRNVPRSLRGTQSRFRLNLLPHRPPTRCVRTLHIACEQEADSSSVQQSATAGLRISGTQNHDRPSTSNASAALHAHDERERCTRTRRTWNAPCVSKQDGAFENFRSVGTGGQMLRDSSAALSTNPDPPSRSRIICTGRSLHDSARLPVCW